MTRPHKNDDLWYAFDDTPPTKFGRDDVADIVAEVPGENDELNWWWILALSDRKFALISAWCDYTGWGCQSGISVEEVHTTAMETALAAPEQESDWKLGRNIRENLVGQLEGRYPKFTYVEQPDAKGESDA